MIVTVTPSPSIDWTVAVDSFDLDAVNRAVSSSREPSGKGVNVSWALHRAGVPTLAVFPAGGGTGAFMSDELSASGVPHRIVDTGADVRTNITLVTPAISGTKINEAGTPLSARVVAELLDEVGAAARTADAVLSCGSLPPGTDPGLHREIVLRAKQNGSSFTIVDTSGTPLTMVLDAKPDMIKPNVHELAELTGRSIATLGDVVAASECARRRGAGAVLASLGADGVLYVDQEGALYGKAEDIPVVNSVGAGDALLAGFVGAHDDRADRLFNAVLWASSAVAHPTTLFPVRPEFAARITVRPLDDPDRRLAEPSAGLTPASI